MAHRITKVVQVENASSGLGLKLIGDSSVDDNSDVGIFIKQVVSDHDGLSQVNVGDQLLAINHMDLTGFSCTRSVMYTWGNEVQIQKCCFAFVLTLRPASKTP